MDDKDDTLGRSEVLSLILPRLRRPLRGLFLGAHCDDIEIGCAATLLRWLQTYRHIEFTWVVMSAAEEARGREARRSARALLHGAAKLEVVLGAFRDAHIPADFTSAKEFVGELNKRLQPDIVLTHRLEDRHQDHRLFAELTWQTWRNHLILEYEVPKYEGDLGQPNLYIPLPRTVARRKVRHLLAHFGSQRSKDWFTAETFLGLMRLRGIECRAPEGFGEAFYVLKFVAEAVAK